jgi:HD-GYP domain-containing protein (c-di-GMP phosphodiesterase class II)
MLSAVLSQTLEIQQEKPLQIVGMAAFFHDIGLVGEDPALEVEDEKDLTPEQKIIYRQHPQKAADVLTKMRTFDAAAVQAIAQHHMRAGGRGFPDRKVGHVTRVAEIVGICDEFHRLLQRKMKKPALNLVLEMEGNSFGGFSKQIVYGFRSAFFPKKMG